MAEVDEKLFNKMNAEDKEDLVDGINRLSDLIDEYSSKLGNDENGQPLIITPLKLAICNTSNPLILCKNIHERVTSDVFTLKLMAEKENESQHDNYEINVYLIDSKYKIISNVNKVKLVVGHMTECSLKIARDIKEDYVYCVIQSSNSDRNEAIRIIPFDVDI